MHQQKKFDSLWSPAMSSAAATEPSTDVSEENEGGGDLRRSGVFWVANTHPVASTSGARGYQVMGDLQ